MLNTNYITPRLSYPNTLPWLGPE